MTEPKVSCPSCFTDEHMFNTYYFIGCSKCKRVWELDDSKEAVKRWQRWNVMLKPAYMNLVDMGDIIFMNMKLESYQLLMSYNNGFVG